ncbi:hypothetical protein ACP6L2_01135 [Sphingobacterium lactis]|uniref:hypothetical protein n=1 Tax=Sphingobacterium lactis TaxID=797291 RepID=UPI003F7E1BD5
MAKTNWGTAFVKNLKANGWVEVNGLILPQNKLTEEQSSTLTTSGAKNKQSRSKGLKTGWIDDGRNLKNKAKQTDPFILLVKQELGLEVWPEFYFSTERLYRIDYAIPVDQNGKVLKIAIEQEGGIWLKGNSGHSSGTGIKRDMEKNNLLQSLGWRLIRRQPSEMMSLETLLLIPDINY